MSADAPTPQEAGQAAPLALLCQALEAVTLPTLVHQGGPVLYANDAMRRLLGRDDAALQALPFYGWADAAQQAQVRDYGLDGLRRGEALPAIEVEALSGGGARRLVELSGRPLRSAEGLLGVFTLQDLSDIRLVQTSLLNAGRVLHQIIENNPVACFVIDAKHRVTHWNAACAQLTGVEASTVLGSREAWRAFYAEARPLLADLIVDGRVEAERERLYGDQCRPSSAIDQAFEVEGFFPNFGGGGSWLYFTAAPLMDAQGGVIGAIETLQDVTRRHEAEERMRQHHTALESMVADRTAELLSTHHELEAFLENASVGIISTAQQRIVRGNRKFCEMFELDDRSAHGLPTRGFFLSEEDYAELGRVAYPVLSQGQSLSHEMAMQTLRGNRIWVQLIAYVADPDNPTASTWWLIQDRTEVRRVQHELQLNYERIKQTNARLEEAQNQLLQSEKMASIGQLAAGVAHEINNPIGFVGSNLGSLRRYLAPMMPLLSQLNRCDAQALPPALGEALQTLRGAVDLEFIEEDLPQLLDESEEGLARVKKIVQDLKDFSRVDHADWQDADLNSGLDSTLNVVMNEVKYKAEVVKRYGELPAVYCIAAQLNQVFMNLIVNAAHAIQGRGVITLSTWTRDDWVCVEVRDTGCGMSEEVRRRIFEPFFTTKPVGQGTGLGLSLSFSIVQKHGGHIEVDSAPGLGTAFRVWVPVRRAQAEPSAAADD